MKNIIALLIVVAVAAGFANSNMEHLRLTNSTPADEAVLEAAPSEIRLWFNQNIHFNVSAIQLSHGNSQLEIPDVEKTDDPKSFRVALPDTLQLMDGSYNIVWATAGNDEHVVKGKLSFSIDSEASSK